MGVRGFIRDLISIYLGYEIIRGYIVGEFSMTNISIGVIIMFLLSIWFILERVGILPKA